MILYADTSALLKLYLDEPHSEMMATAFEGAESVVTHLLAYAEMRAGLSRAVRMERITADDLGGFRTQLETHWRNLNVVTVTETMTRRAGDLSERFGLRAYDSIHLAAVESVATVLDGDVELRFAVFDQQLADAAKALGIHILEH